MIPNLRMVDGDLKIFRGGQPQCLADWQRLQHMGVVNVIKLNSDEDGKDESFTVELGMQLTKCYIPNISLAFHVDAQTLGAAVEFIVPRTFVHCEHGEDRTGCACGLYRTSTGWSKADAWREMIECGFHQVFYGLTEAFWGRSLDILDKHGDV